MQTTTVFFQPDQPIVGTATHLRGYIATQFSEHVLLHQHDANTNKLRYFYPRVQYKVIEGVPVVVGLKEGARLVRKIVSKIELLRLAGRAYKVVGQDITENAGPFGISHEPVRYSFLTPWLALNEKNYENYRKAEPREQRHLLRRILIGNILSMSKGLGYVVTQEIFVSELKIYPLKAPVRLKRVLMIGCQGIFKVNFEIPDYWGIGKSVSRGFGTVKRVKNGN